MYYKQAFYDIILHDGLSERPYQYVIYISGGKQMKTCPKCGAQVADDAGFCTVCGFNFSAAGAAPQGAPQGAPQPQYQQAQYQQAPVQSVTDHTSEFTAQEISEGKVYALAIYLIPIFGVLIALIGSTGNKFTGFHVRAWLKLQIVQALAAIIGIIPFLGWFVLGVWTLINLVLHIICFVNVCSGKAIDPPIVSSFGFLK